MTEYLANSSSRVKGLVDQLVKIVGQVVEAVVEDGARFDERERATLEVTNEVSRRCLEGILQVMADGYGDRLRINHHHDHYLKHPRNDIIYDRHQPGEVAYHSLCGDLRVQRWSYRWADDRNGPTVVPVELEAALMERCTPALARSIALGYAKGPMRSYREDLEASHRRPPSRAALENIAKKIGTHAKFAMFFIESEIRRAEKVPMEATTIAIGIDRTSVPMAEERTEPRERRLRRSKPRVRKKPKPVQVQWRMDYVGTFSLLDKDGEKLVTRCYRLPSGHHAPDLVRKLGEDIRQALRQRPDLKIVVTQDGAMELWNLIRDRFGQQHNPLGNKKWYEVLDWYHAAERLHACLTVLEPDDAKRKGLQERWHRHLKRVTRGVDDLLRWLRRKRSKLSGEQRNELQTHIHYFSKRKSLMQYAKMRRLHLPIGSGITEGVCKSLIAARAKRSGQRWSQRGLTVVLNLRALHQSERLNAFWDRFELRYRASRICAAA